MRSGNGRLEVKLSDFLLVMLFISIVVQTFLEIDSSSRVLERLSDLSAKVERLIEVTGGER